MGMGAGGMSFTIDGKQFDPNRVDQRVSLGPWRSGRSPTPHRLTTSALCTCGRCRSSPRSVARFRTYGGERGPGLSPASTRSLGATGPAARTTNTRQGRCSRRRPSTTPVTSPRVRPRPLRHAKPPQGSCWCRLRPHARPSEERQRGGAERARPVARRPAGLSPGQHAAVPRRPARQDPNSQGLPGAAIRRESPRAAVSPERVSAAAASRAARPGPDRLGCVDARPGSRGADRRRKHP